MGRGKQTDNLLVGISLIVTSKILFGLSFMFTKQAAANNGVFTLLGWRFVVAFVTFTLLIVAGIFKVDFKGKSLKPVIYISILQPGLYFIAETLGIRATTASESGAILACIPVGGIIASALILKKKPYPDQAIGIAITVVGVIISMLAQGVSASFSIFGYTMLIIAIVLTSLYCVFVERLEGFTAIEITYVMAWVGTIFFGTIALVQNGLEGSLLSLMKLPFQDREFLVAILYQGIGCSVIAFLFNNRALSTLGTNQSVSFIGLTTVVGILGGVVVLGESFSKLQVIGTITILLGVYIANFKLIKGER